MKHFHWKFLWNHLKIKLNEQKHFSKSEKTSFWVPKKNNFSATWEAHCLPQVSWLTVVSFPCRPRCQPEWGFQFKIGEFWGGKKVSLLGQSLHWRSSQVFPVKIKVLQIRHQILSCNQLSCVYTWDYFHLDLHGSLFALSCSKPCYSIVQERLSLLM